MGSFRLGQVTGFELQGHVSEHAMDISQINGVLWTLAHLSVFVCGAGASYWAVIDPQENRGRSTSATCFWVHVPAPLLSLTIMLLHGRLHNDRRPGRAGARGLRAHIVHHHDLRHPDQGPDNLVLICVCCS